VTAGRETWVVEATGGCFEVAKKKQTPDPWRQTIGGGERLLGEAKFRQWCVKILAHQMSWRQGGREGKFEHPRIFEGGNCCWGRSLNNYIFACVIFRSWCPNFSCWPLTLLRGPLTLLRGQGFTPSWNV
jgi:hypothetical protein